jgi:hypothetical protein
MTGPPSSMFESISTCITAEASMTWTFSFQPIASIRMSNGIPLASAAVLTRCMTGESSTSWMNSVNGAVSGSLGTV